MKDEKQLAGTAELEVAPNPLSVRNLCVDYKARRGTVKAVRDVTFDLLPGESFSLIGESGSGKTTLGLALIRLLVKAATIREGEIIYRRGHEELNVLKLSDEELRHFR